MSKPNSPAFTDYGFPSMPSMNGSVPVGNAYLGKTVKMEPSEKKSRDATELEKFDDLFPILISDLTRAELKNPEISQAAAWFKRVSEYNVPFGKKNRGLTVVHSYHFLKGEEATEEDLHLARVLGWCVEWLQAFFLVADDIMDGSTLRRGQLCWYKKPEVGLTAVNDSFYLENALYIILKKYFRDKSYYADLLDLFHETVMQTIYGQNLDLLTAPTNEVNFTNFTLERYNAIVKWKTGYYSFYLPVACALYMCGIDAAESHTNAKTILLKMGEYFQIQDDYLDCYGDPSVIGKVGRDIQENKCSWLVVQALHKATPEQIEQLQMNYAQEDLEKVRRVKTLFDDLKLQDLFKQYEEQSYQDLITLIERHSGEFPKEMFIVYAQKIYKRQK